MIQSLIYIWINEDHRSFHNPRPRFRGQQLDLRRPRHLRWCQQSHLSRRQSRIVNNPSFRLNLLPTLANQATAATLREDLGNVDSSKHKLKDIDVASVAQIFTYFGLKDPNCDTNKNGKIDGDELKCLNKIWRYYLPKWFNPSIPYLINTMNLIKSNTITVLIVCSTLTSSN